MNRLRTLNMGIGVIFIVFGIVENVEVCFSVDCLMKKAVEARRVDVRRVLRGW